MGFQIIVVDSGAAKGFMELQLRQTVALETIATALSDDAKLQALTQSLKEHSAALKGVLPQSDIS